MTDEQKWLCRKYLAYKIFANLWFFGVVWLYFYRIYITDQQVGILDGMAFAIGLLAEVPSGALADKFGRDKMVRLGQILAGGGLLIQIAGSSFMPFFVGQAIMMVGLAFVSGADEALFFERLKFKRTSAQWRKLLIRGAQVTLVATLVATAIGGWLHTINPRIPWVLTGAAFIAAGLIIWPVKDTRPKSVRKNISGEIKDYLQDIKTGFAQFRMPKLRLYVPIILTVQGLFYTSSYGILQTILLSRFHFSPFWGSIAVATAGLITIAILAILHKHADSVSEKKVISVIALSAAAGLLLSLADIGLWGYAVILVIYAGDHILYPFMSDILNYQAPEEQRATVLSVASFLRTLPYVVLGPIIGYLSTHGTLGYFLAGWALLIILSVVLYFSHKKRDDKIKVEQEIFITEEKVID